MTSDIKKIMKSFRMPKKAEFRTVSAKARHDWKLIVIGSAILALIVVLYNGELFLHVTKDETAITISTGASARAAVNQKTLEQTIDYYKAKADKLETLKTNRPSTFDPSL